MGLGRLMAIAVAIIVSISQQSHAQTRDNVLRGLDEVDVTVEELTESNKACGIDEDAVTNAIKYPVSSSYPRIEPSAPVVFYVRVTSIFDRADSGCFSNVDVQVYAVQSVTLEFSGANRFLRVMLWQKNVVLSNSRVRHPRFVTETVDESVKKFITDWNLDNKSETGTRTRGRQ